MILLNLLSPHKRARLKGLIRYLFIKELLELVLLTSALVALAYLFGWMVLTSFLNDLSISTTLVNRDYSSYNQEIVKINALIKKISLASDGYATLLPHLADLAKNLPDDIKLDSVTLNRRGQKITLAGTAKTRDALLNYQAVIKGVNWIGNFEIPPSQLFQKDNIGFEISASLKNFPPLK